MLSVDRAMVLLEQRMISFEKMANPIDWAPWISSGSGIARIGAGSVQLIAGLAFAILKIFKAIFLESSYEFRKSWGGIVHILHGGGNILRGSIAILPGVNLLLLAYDALIGRCNYRHEQMDRGVYPLNLDFV